MGSSNVWLKATVPPAMSGLGVRARTAWYYKCNATQPGPAGYWGDWDDVLRVYRTVEWGGTHCVVSPESKQSFEAMQVGNLIVCYQTDLKAVVGFATVQRVKRQGSGDVRIWVRPVLRLASDLLIHEVKRGTVLEKSPAVNGPVGVRPLTRTQLRVLLRLAGHPTLV